MALPFTETFTGTNGTAISSYNASWSNILSGLIIQSNGIQGNNLNADSSARWTSDSPNADQIVSIKLVNLVLGSYIGPAARCSASGGYYLYISTGDWELGCDNSGYRTLTSGSRTQALNDVWELEVTGTGATVTLKIRVNGSQLGSTVLDTHANRITAAGQGGIIAHNNGGMRGDDLTISNVSAGGSSYTRNATWTGGITSGSGRAQVLTRRAAITTGITSGAGRQRIGTRLVAWTIAAATAANRQQAAQRSAAWTGSHSSTGSRTAVLTRSSVATVAATTAAGRTAQQTRTAALTQTSATSAARTAALTRSTALTVTHSSSSSRLMAGSVLCTVTWTISSAIGAARQTQVLRQVTQTIAFSSTVLRQNNAVRSTAWQTAASTNAIRAAVLTRRASVNAALSSSAARQTQATRSTLLTVLHSSSASRSAAAALIRSAAWTIGCSSSGSRSAAVVRSTTMTATHSSSSTRQRSAIRTITWTLPILVTARRGGAVYVAGTVQLRQVRQAVQLQIARRAHLTQRQMMVRLAMVADVVNRGDSLVFEATLRDASGTLLPVAGTWKATLKRQLTDSDAQALGSAVGTVIDTNTVQFVFAPAVTDSLTTDTYLWIDAKGLVNGLTVSSLAQQILVKRNVTRSVP